ncbi:Putative FAD-binding domain, PCMH-type, FAD-binding, type PCMH, subdomain 2 [Colletotrichum destructivum]|uniref:FAD-binding domain, PCMH-type, FAD-binding, type PCMH, subdomain 2 n=1 Tax=Colletotrichum destructivum TaxID=34406 RepID=A0AAX4IG86_9PEZI|nr:Putative FAD-binding domain, PCMH-type, FAD-binding, type PCMH, subdomain 2 [Colletotrichum destructivum]
MYRLKIKVFTALAAWTITSACLNVPVARQLLGGICARDTADLGERLSPTAKIYQPGTAEFIAASTRWSNLNPPKPNLVVVPGTENDVVETVKFANEKNVPFLAYNGMHGAITTLGEMESGIEIYINQLSGVEVASDGKTAKISGGTRSKLVTDTLWEAGKQTVTGTCECVSALGPSLGGGHGWLQGHYGLVADQFLSMNIVLADGTLRTINETSDLWWAVKGAGHNFGIVTSVDVKIYDIEHRDWAVETLIFSGDKVEDVYQAVNDHLLKNGTQAVDVINWSYWLNNPDADPENPIILFWILQEGVTTVDPVYTEPFRDIGPISSTPGAGTYLDLAAWTGIALDSPPCQKAGLNNPRFPIYVESYNVEAQRKAYDLFASSVKGDSPFSNSLFMFEGYSAQGVKAVESDSTAFAYRGDNLLFAPLITYTPGGAELDQQAAILGNQLRDIIHEGSGRSEKHVYLNYAFGDESPKEWYGSEQWRQDRLKALKAKYDPNGRFSFYGPIA